MMRQKTERHGETGDSRRHGETEDSGRHGETGDRGRLGHGEGGQKKSDR